MSRTYKDRPSWVKYPEDHWKVFDEYESVPYIAKGSHWSTGEPYERLSWYRIKKPYLKRKKARHVDTTWHWMSTPSWWTRLFMNRPQRSRSNQYMRQITLDVNLEEIDPPLVGNKPHVYYY